MERDDHMPLTHNAELHFINMKNFLGELREAHEGEMSNFTKWLALITQQGIEDKSIIDKICEEGEYMDAMATLARHSADAETRRLYYRRMDQIRLWDSIRSELEEERRAKEEERKAKEEERRAKEEERKGRISAIKLLHSSGMPEEVIAENLEMTIYEVQACLNE
jgi:hypothetical protein